MDRLPVGQPEAYWRGPDRVAICRAGQIVAFLPVDHTHKTREIVKAGGNRKTRGVTGIINSLSQGCLRRATGFGNCEAPCYAANGRGGCFANNSGWANRKKNREQQYNVVHNGLVNDLLTIRVPRDPQTLLSSVRGRKISRVPVLWRVDAESSDGSLSIALGIPQMWATHNPEMRFTTISSDYFRPSDEMLEWVAATGNIWVGHTVSAWFAADDLNSRFRSIARYLDAGIPTTVWIVTSAAWDNQAVVRRVLDLVSPQHIIEASLSHGSEAQDNPLLGLNPLGPCGSQRYDRQGRLCVPVDGVYRVPLEAGGYAKPSGVPHATISNWPLRWPSGFSGFSRGRLSPRSSGRWWRCRC